LYQRKRRGRRNLVVEKLAEQQRARRGGDEHRGHSSSASEKSPPPHVNGGVKQQPFFVGPDDFHKANNQSSSQGLAYPYNPHPQLDPLRPALVGYDTSFPQPSAPTSQYVSPPSAVSDRIEHPASPPLPTGLTPYTNPESTGPAQLKLDAFISRDLANLTIGLFFEHVRISAARSF
jgi:hypothetical protein